MSIRPTPEEVEENVKESSFNMELFEEHIKDLKDTDTATPFFQNLNKGIKEFGGSFLTPSQREFVNIDTQEMLLGLLETFQAQMKQANPGTQPISTWMALAIFCEILVHSCVHPKAIVHMHRLVQSMDESVKGCAQVVVTHALRQAFIDAFKQPNPNPNPKDTGR